MLVAQRQVRLAGRKNPWQCRLMPPCSGDHATASAAPGERLELLFARSPSFPPYFLPIAPSFFAARETFSPPASTVSCPMSETRPEWGLWCQEVLAQ